MTKWRLNRARGIYVGGVTICLGLRLVFEPQCFHKPIQRVMELNNKAAKLVQIYRGAIERGFQKNSVGQILDGKR